METTFRIAYSAHSTGAKCDFLTMFHRLSEMICEECGGSCQGFFLTDDFAKYQAHKGPKIGWASDGTNILLRMANCKELARVDHITQFLKHFQMNVVDSRVVH